MLETVKRTIAEYQMLQPGESVLVALSGGADSTAALRVLLELGYAVRAFHLNHCLRGEEADRDEAFCRSLCDTLHVPLQIARADVAAEAERYGEGIELAARRIRYDALYAAAGEYKIVTAHNADDVVETVLFHLVRGTGPAGLAGIPPVRGKLLRPLIHVTRQEIEAYLREKNQGYVTDSTNADTCYTRNRIRHKVVPELRVINPALSKAVMRLSTILQQDNAYIEQMAAAKLARAAADNDRWRVDAFRSEHPAVRSRMLRQMAEHVGVPMKDFTAQHIEALQKIVFSEMPSAAYSLPHGFTACREYDKIYITKEYTAKIRKKVPLTVPFDGWVWNGSLHLTIRRLEKKEVFYKTFNTFCVDCGTICYDTLCVRTRLSGDRIRLTAHSGSKTLKKLMIDRKIPRIQRDQLAVVADKNGIIAVEGIGVDIARTPKNGELIVIKIEG